MFNWAGERGWKGDNPAAKFKRNKETKRKRFLDGEELPEFWRSLAQEENATVRDYFLTCLLTGGRCRGNVLEMRWDEIRWKRMVWHIPGEKFKNGEAEDVQLVPIMVLLLRQRQAAPDADPVWVFPGRGKTGHLVEPKRAWRRILKRAGISNCRIHDLRRTLGSVDELSLCVVNPSDSLNAA
jgi:integrase